MTTTSTNSRKRDVVLALTAAVFGAIASTVALYAFTVIGV